MKEPIKRYRPKTGVKEMFKNREHLPSLFEGYPIESKRKLIAKSSGPLFYVFGYKLKVYKSWLTYGENYGITG
jgi:hypothetical protein